MAKNRKSADSETIDFTGEELKSMEDYAKYRRNRSHESGQRDDYIADDVAGEARSNQLRKGKSVEAANDAADVFSRQKYAKGGLIPRGCGVAVKGKTYNFS